MSPRGSEPQALTVVAADAHRAHDTVAVNDGALVRSPESPDRVEIIGAELRRAGHPFTRPGEIDADALSAVHTEEYIDFLSTAWDRWAGRDRAGPAAMGFAWPTRGFAAARPDDIVGQLGFHSFSSDTSMVAGTWAAALSSAAIALTAADLVADDGSPTYGLCRPPGHHATADQFGGYCYLNNAALAAQRLLDRGAGRVAVLDIDYHHGNGTQSIFHDRSDVLVISIHADPRHEFPWYAGYAQERGVGPGEGWTLNLPLALGSDFATWAGAMDVALHRLVEVGVDALVVSLGVDTYKDDPVGTFGLTTADFTTVGRRVSSLGMPTVVLQEGGYAVRDLGVNVAAFLAPFVS